MLELAWGARTDVGRRRTRNEDAFVAEARVFAVADGMGGHARGDVAAAIAVEGLRAIAGTPFDRSQLLDAIRGTHEAIALAAVAGGEGDMGTTLCGVAVPDGVEPGSVLVFNVGDSRVYCLRDGDLAQLTHDHSVVQELLDEGHIAPESASTHPERHVVTRSLGSGDRLDIDWWAVDVQAGDRFLVCSDGLVKEVGPADLAEALAASPSAQEAADDLLERALGAGARDNVTVVVVDVTRVPEPVSLDPLGAATDSRLLDTATAPRPGATPPGPVVVAAAPMPDGRQPTAQAESRP